MAATTPHGNDLDAAAERPGSVVVEAVPGALLVRLVGGIDSALAARLEAAVAAVAAGQPADVRLDLTEVDFLGSHGMAFLIRIRRAALVGDRKADIVGISRSARVALQIAGLAEFLRV